MWLVASAVFATVGVVVLLAVTLTQRSYNAPTVAVTSPARQQAPPPDLVPIQPSLVVPVKPDPLGIETPKNERTAPAIDPSKVKWNDAPATNPAAIPPPPPGFILDPPQKPQVDIFDRITPDKAVPVPPAIAATGAADTGAESATLAPPKKGDATDMRNWEALELASVRGKLKASDVRKALGSPKEKLGGAGDDVWIYRNGGQVLFRGGEVKSIYPP